MDIAPLSTAHEFVRDAALNVRYRSQTAVEKHRAAAAEFSKATEGIDDSEALRVLKLLEQHHQRLADIISSTSDRSQPKGKSQESVTKVEDSVLPKATPSASSSSTSTARESALSRPSQAATQRRQGRDLSSSIASNLATARGIPGSNNRRGLNSTLAPVKESPTRQYGRQSQQEISRIPGQDDDGQSAAKRTSEWSHDSKAVGATSQGQVAAVDDAQAEATFQKFFNTFEGLLGKLSAPLAFAGLPLGPEESQSSSRGIADSTPKLPAEATIRATSPDISKIYSKAALRAMKDDHGLLGVQESFFVVPTAGGTVSYAGVLSRDERQQRYQSLESSSAEGHSDEIARLLSEAGSQAPKAGGKGVQNTTRMTTKTREELEIENASLKDQTDKLTHRLHMWEMSAQSQSIALQQSIKSLQPPPRETSEYAVGAHGANQDKEMREMEEQLMLAQKELERYGRENDKLTAVVLRYRQRWEKLKEGARVRREGAVRGADAQQSNEDSAGGADAS